MKRLLSLAFIFICCTAQMFPIPGPGRPTFIGGGSYTWALGDLTTYDTTIPIIDPDAWPDALWATAATWTTKSYTLNAGEGFDCADGTANEDGTAMNTIMTAAGKADCDATGDCGGATFTIPASCHIDISGLTFSKRYSNYRITGSGMNSSYLDCNDIASDDGTLAGANNDGDDNINGSGGCWPLNDGSWNIGSTATGSCTWSSGTARGATALTVTGCTGTAAAAGDAIYAIGTIGGITQKWATRVVSNAAGVITLEEGLPSAMSAGTVEIHNDWIENVVIDNITLGYSRAAKGQSSSTSASADTDESAIQAHGVNYLLVQDAAIGPWVQSAIDQRNAIVAVRNSYLKENLRSWARNTRVGGLSTPMGGRLTAYGNYYGPGGSRMLGVDGDADFTYFGFNFQASQVPTVGTGTYCDEIVTGDANYPYQNVGDGERGIFMHSDPVNNTDPGGMVIEANRVVCGFVEDARATGLDFATGWTFLRNEVDLNELINSGNSGAFMTNPSSSVVWPGAILAGNRFARLLSGAHSIQDWKGIYNVTSTSTSTAPSGTGVTWSTDNETNRLAANSNYATAVLPPSVAFRTDTPPASLRWCSESGEWSDRWKYAGLACRDLFNNVTGSAQTSGRPDGICDSDGVGTRGRLPAEIAYYGDTCTHVGW